MLNQLKKILGIVVLGLMLVSQSGCVALLVGAAAGAGGIAYIKGTLEKNFDRPVKRAHKATLAALKDLKLVIKEEELNQHSSKIKAEYPDETKVYIDITALTEKSSTIKIRVGIFGDQDKSQMILNAVMKRL